MSGRGWGSFAPQQHVVHLRAAQAHVLAAGHVSLLLLVLISLHHKGSTDKRDLQPERPTIDVGRGLGLQEAMHDLSQCLH